MYYSVLLIFLPSTYAIHQFRFHEINFIDQEYDLFSKKEILEQIDYLLDVYIYLSNKNINFSNLDFDFEMAILKLGHQINEIENRHYYLNLFLQKMQYLPIDYYFPH